MHRATASGLKAAKAWHRLDPVMNQLTLCSQPGFQGLQDSATSVPRAAPAPAPSSSQQQEVYLQRYGGAQRPAPQLPGDSAARILATQGQGSVAGHPSTCGFPKATAGRLGKGQTLGSLLLGGHDPSRHKLPWQMGVLRSPPPLEVSAEAGNPATHDELHQRLKSSARGLLRIYALEPSTGMENSNMEACAGEALALPRLP